MRRSRAGDQGHDRLAPPLTCPLGFPSASPLSIPVSIPVSMSTHVKVAVVVVALVVCALAEKLPSKVISRTVSVKSPERVSGVISHFTPADHRYEATGSVLISKEPAEASRPNLQAYNPPASILRRKSAEPQGSVRKVERKISRPAPSFSSGAASADKLALTRTVSVKTPKRVPTVISHFVPADHRYEATGSVTIVRGSQSSARGSVGGSAAPAPARVRVPAPAPVRAPARAPARRVQVTKKISRPAQSSASAANLALTRTVSVKSPKRVQNVISHFVPAEHQYEATGSVTIVRGSESSSRKASGASASGAAATPVPAPSPAFYKPPRPVEVVRRVSQPVKSFSSASTSDANLALTRTVSVKSPERASSVISHFLPAEHKYEATGSVTIVKGSTGGRQSTGFGQASSGRKVSSGSASFGAGRGSTFSAFGQASGSASGQASSRKTASGQRQGGSFDASTSTGSNTSGRKTSFSASDSSSRRQESVSGGRASTSAGQTSSGRVSFGASQGASAGTFAQSSGSGSRFSGGQNSASVSQKASTSSGRKDSSSARKQASASASASRGSGFSASASAQRSQASAAASAQRSQASAAAAAAAAARDSSEESYSYQLAESYRGGSSVSAAELRAELQSFREDAAKSGVKISQTKQSRRDDYDGSDSGPYTFSIRVQDDDSTNYQSRDEWVGEDGVIYGWYTVVMPDGYSYNHTYTSHPVKGYQVKVTRKDSGIALKPVKANIFAPATIFSNKGVGKFAEFAISGVNNNYEEEDNMSYEENAAAMFADSLSEALKVTQQSSSTRAAVSTGRPSHICGHRIVRVHGSRTPGRKTVEDLVYGPCTYTQETSVHGSSGFAAGTSGSASGSRSSGSASAGSSASFGSKASSSSSRSESQSSGSAFRSASKKSGSASRSASQSGSASRSASQSGSAFGSASQSGSAFGSASKSGSASGSARQSGSAFGSASQSGSAFGSASQSAGSGSRKASAGSSGASSARFFQSSGSGSSSRGSGASKSSGARFFGSAGASSSEDSDENKSSGFFRFVKDSSDSGSSKENSDEDFSKFSSSSSSFSRGFTSSTRTGGGSGGGLTRTVSVKSPTRHSGVISHFTPADHIYDATAGVTLGSGSIRQSSKPSQAVFVSTKRGSSASAARKAAEASRAAGSRASQLGLRRTVSVKSPDRKSSVISHFTPAEHRYEAVGGVIINRESEQSFSSASPVKTFTVKASPAPVRTRAPAPAPAPATARGYGPPSRPSSPSGLSLTRTVSVKSPERKSSVISHFTPAEHIYEATGSVTINKSSV